MCEEADVLIGAAGLVLAFVVLDVDHDTVVTDGNRPSALGVSPRQLIKLALPDGLPATHVHQDAESPKELFRGRFERGDRTLSPPVTLAGSTVLSKKEITQMF